MVEKIEDVVASYRRNYQDNEELPEAHRAAIRAVLALCDRLEQITQSVKEAVN